MARKTKKPLSRIARRIEERGTEGALRRTAKRLGLIKDDEPLSKADLDKLAAHARKTHNTTLARRVAAARAFMNASRKRRRK